MTGFDNSTSLPRLSSQNTSGNLDTVTNETVFAIPVPNDLLPQSSQANNLGDNEAGDLNDNSDGNQNNNPDQGDHHNEGDNVDLDKNGKGKGKAKGHDKNKGN